MKFKTFHKTKNHWAIVGNEKIGPFTTEVDLARALVPKANLQEFNYEAAKNEDVIEITWWKA